MVRVEVKSLQEKLLKDLQVCLQHGSRQLQRLIRIVLKAPPFILLFHQIELDACFTFHKIYKLIHSYNLQFT